MWRNKVIQKRIRRRAEVVLRRMKTNFVYFVETMVGHKLNESTKTLMLNLSKVDFDRLRNEMYGRR